MEFISERVRRREEAKTLDLLAFALDRAGVDRRAWATTETREDLPPVDDCLCLYRDGASWVASYTERGVWREIGRFPLCNNAVEFFFWHLTNATPNPYAFREAWEAESGQQFSLVE
jgi:hypothetical protein